MGTIIFLETVLEVINKIKVVTMIILVKIFWAKIRRNNNIFLEIVWDVINQVMFLGAINRTNNFIIIIFLEIFLEVINKIKIILVEIFLAMSNKIKVAKIIEMILDIVNKNQI